MSNSGGFVYFPTDGSPRSAATSDFMGFDGGSDPAAGVTSPPFSPGVYSSPNRYQRTPRQRGGNRWTRKSFPYNQNRTFQGRFSGGGGASGGCSPLNYSVSPEGRFSRSEGWRQNFNKPFDKSAYLKKSFIEDPWAQLESRLQVQQTQNMSAPIAE